MMEGIPEEIAERLKNEGNEAFKVNNLALAITKYSQSLGTCVSLFKNAELVKSEGVYTNRAASYIKQKK